MLTHISHKYWLCIKGLTYSPTDSVLPAVTNMLSPMASRFNVSSSEASTNLPAFPEVQQCGFEILAHLLRDPSNPPSPALKFTLGEFAVRLQTCSSTCTCKQPALAGNQHLHKLANKRANLHEYHGFFIVINVAIVINSVFSNFLQNNM